jgi:hypothetical protein
MNRFTALGLVTAACVVLAACGGDPGEEPARAACKGYGGTTSDAASGQAARTAARERAQRAGAANSAYATLAGDMDDAWERADAMADAHNSGQQVGGHELEAYIAADDRVRRDCADAGADLGPLEP